MSYFDFPTGDLDLNAALNTVAGLWDVRPFRRLHLDVVLTTGTWATAVVEIEQSINGDEWYSFDPVRLLHQGLNLNIDVSDISYVRSKLTTAEGGAGEVLLSPRGESLAGVEAPVVLTPVQGATNGATPVTIIAAPATGKRRVLEPGDLAVLNEDTVTATVILTLNAVVVERVALTAGSKFVNSDRLVVDAGSTLTITLGGAVTTNELNWHAAYREMSV